MCRNHIKGAVTEATGQLHPIQYVNKKHQNKTSYQGFDNMTLSFHRSGTPASEDIY
jgi:hypothetical protein